MMEKQKVKRSRSSIGAIAAAVAVLLIAAFVVQDRFGLVNPRTVAQLTPGNSITLTRGKGTVYINKVEGIRSSKLFIPEGAYSKDYNMEQLGEFFGRNPLPEIPEGFKPESTGTNITFDPQGKMLFMSSISYSKNIDDPDSPRIDIKLNKNELPPKDCIYAEGTKESIIGSTKVIIGAAAMEDKFDDEGKPTAFYDLYTAEFIYDGIGYNITAARTDGDTFLNLINNIIK